jgi:hypothetical protein
MGAFTRYYHVQGIIKGVEEENRKSDEAAREGKDYVRKYIVGTGDSIASASGEEAMILQHLLDRGVNNMEMRPAEIDSQFTAGDFAAQIGIGVANIPNVAGKMAKQAVEANAPEYKMARLVGRINDSLRVIRERKGTLLEHAPLIGVKRQYDALEHDLRELVTLYSKEGYSDLAVETAWKLHDFYMNYPQKLVKVDPVKRAEINKEIAKDSEWMWKDDNFSKATQVFHPSELAAQTYALIRQFEAQKEYATEHTSMSERADVQTAMNREIVAAGLFNKINERTRIELPSIGSVYDWVTKNSDNSVYVDAFDEKNNHSMSDIIINFNTNGQRAHSIRLPNTYGNIKDFSFDSVPGMKNITDALEATQPTL